MLKLIKPFTTTSLLPYDVFIHNLGTDIGRLGDFKTKFQNCSESKLSNKTPHPI